MSLPTHGDIAAQPIGSLVFSLAAAGFDGELTLEQDNRRATLWFARGQVVDAESSYPEDQVLRVMVAANLITNAQVGQTLQKMAQQPDKSPIVLACELGFLRPDLVPRVELHALARRALRPFAMPSARYGFDAKPLPRGPVSEIDARWLVYRGVREYFDGTRLTRELGQLSGMGLKLASAALDAYGFTEPELVVATYLSKGYWEIPDLLDAAISVPQQVALSTIYALCTTGAVDVQPAGSVSLLKKRGPEQTAKVPAAVVQAITAQPAPASPSASAPVRPAPPAATASASDSAPDGMVEGFAATQIAGASAPVAAQPLPDLDSTALAAGSGPSTPITPPEGFTPTIEQLAFVRRTPAPPPPPSRPIGPPVGLGGRQDTFDLEEPAPIPERPPVAAPVPVPAVPDPASSGLAFTPSTPTGNFTPAPPSQPFSPAPPSQPFSPAPPSQPFTAPPTGSFRSPGTGASPNPMLTAGPRPGTYIQGRAATGTSIPAVPPARPATPPPPAAHSPAQPTATAPPGLRDQILRKFAAIEKGADHFTILELTREADSAKIKAAYFNLAKLYHPDRVAILKLDDLKPQIERIFAALSQSFAAIGDDARRLEYMKILAQGGTAAVRAREDKEAERAAQIISAEEQFQIGEMAIRRQNWAQAREAFQRAVILNKDEAEHHAYLGWSIFMGASDKNVVLNDVKKHLAKALDINTRCAAAHFFVGKMYLTVGDEARALNAFQHVLDEQPEHVEAQREIRILDMRNKNQKKGGLFDKFKRK